MGSVVLNIIHFQTIRANYELYGKINCSGAIFIKHLRFLLKLHFVPGEGQHICDMSDKLTNVIIWCSRMDVGRGAGGGGGGGGAGPPII